VADQELTYADVWKTLAKEDVSAYTQEKGKLTYLSWSRAWIILMKHYPHAEFMIGIVCLIGRCLMVQPKW